MRKRAIIFHPAIAPYRVDFFNSLNREFEALFYFEFKDALEQSFMQDKLKARLSFVPRFLDMGYKKFEVAGSIYTLERKARCRFLQ